MYILITSHTTWDGGDSVITEGVKTLLPQLKDDVVMLSKQIPHDQTELYVQNAKYIIQAGTPSWLTYDNRRFWNACIKHKKPLAMLGIGLTVHYSSDMWYGSEDFIKLRDSGMIDLIVCRDKFCYYWLHQRLGFNSEKIDLLPCPAFYTLPVNARTTKDNVVFSVANIEETSHQTDATFKDYYSKCVYVIKELRASGVNVAPIYQRNIDIPEFSGMKTMVEEALGENVTHFTSQASFQDFLEDKDVYIGVRNHGALPCAGSGKPSLLLGTDYRQFLADEIPFICRIDASYVSWQPRMVLDWFHALDVNSYSKCLINYRNTTMRRWEETLDKIKDRFS